MKGIKLLRTLKKWLKTKIMASLFRGFFKKRGGHMFQINEDKSIYLTRGDACIIKVSVKDKDGNVKTLQEGDVVRIKVTDKKKCGSVVLQKDVRANAEMTEVQIPLTRDETKFGKVISAPKDYWYEIELNPDTAPQTIVGYDDDGAKLFKLFPEGGDVV